MDVHVVKLGGSLLDVMDLPARLQGWMDAQGSATWVLVVGGGAAADVVRAWDRLHDVGPHRGHWLAVRAMHLNAECVAAVMDDAKMVSGPDDIDAALFNIVEPIAWLSRKDDVPHRWSFTSDSIAAHVAKELGAARLTLLKSAAEGDDLVDADFKVASRGIARVELINFRARP